jgi:hypothetical protein
MENDRKVTVKRVKVVKNGFFIVNKAETREEKFGCVTTRTTNPRRLNSHNRRLYHSIILTTHVVTVVTIVAVMTDSGVSCDIGECWCQL